MFANREVGSGYFSCCTDWVILGHRKVVRRPSVKLSPATVCMVNPQRGLELMIAFEKREARKGMIASCLGWVGSLWQLMYCLLAAA